MDYLLNLYVKDLMKKNKIKGDSFYLGIGRASPPVHNKHALVDMIASVAQRISPSWRDYRIVRHRHQSLRVLQPH